MGKGSEDAPRWGAREHQPWHQSPGRAGLSYVCGISGWRTRTRQGPRPRLGSFCACTTNDSLEFKLLTLDRPATARHEQPSPLKCDAHSLRTSDVPLSVGRRSSSGRATPCGVEGKTRE
ncbi:hypothetical protein HKI87_19g89760 [Chloropicon roscoffensis]|uniref:Uncharacterized protein n=1 Tax=Chloropicon roscoffensis TaxID=1461544 RepID=A0AAX4PP13_9CHLO